MSDSRARYSAEVNLILSDHHELGQLLQRLESTLVSGGTAALLASLQIVLERRFGREEAPDGLFEVIDTRAPRHAARVEVLRRQHREMLGELASLTERAQAAVISSSFRKDVEAFSEALRAHEREESNLLVDVLSTDLGGGD